MLHARGEEEGHRLVSACIAADGTLGQETFTNPGDSCTEAGAYARNGRISLQLNCTNKEGQVTQLVDGDFASDDSFTAKVTTTTYFSGAGDYQLTRTVSGKRTGDCPAGGVAPPAKPKA